MKISRSFLHGRNLSLYFTNQTCTTTLLIKNTQFTFPSVCELITLIIMTQCVAHEQTQQFCLHSLMEVHEGHIQSSEPRCHFQKSSVIPRTKASPASPPHPLLVKVQYWWISIIDYSQMDWILMDLLRYLLKSKEVFVSAAVLHSPHWHWGRGPQVAHATLPARALLQHWDTAGQTKQALGMQRGQIPCCCKFFWKLRILIPQLQNTESFSCEVIKCAITLSTLLGQLYSAFPIA